MGKYPYVGELHGSTRFNFTVSCAIFKMAKANKNILLSFRFLIKKFLNQLIMSLKGIFTKQ